jgi:uncharacterized protein YjbI with pentapeptide repeats
MISGAFRLVEARGDTREGVVQVKRLGFWGLFAFVLLVLFVGGAPSSDASERLQGEHCPTDDAPVLPGSNWAGRYLRDCPLTFTATAEGFDDTRFQGANLRGAWLFSSRLNRTNFIGADLEGARLDRSIGDRTDFLGSHAVSADFFATRFVQPNFRGADLQLSTFLYSTLSEADLTGADLTGADMVCLAAPRATFTGADLSPDDVTGCEGCPAADLRGANLRGTNFQGADLRGANLSFADLTGADLRGANLVGANLNCATLTDALTTGAAGLPAAIPCSFDDYAPGIGNMSAQGSLRTENPTPDLKTFSFTAGAPCTACDRVSLNPAWASAVHITALNLRFYTDNTVEMLPFEPVVVGPFNYPYAGAESCPIFMTMTLEASELGAWNPDNGKIEIPVKLRITLATGAGCAAPWSSISYLHVALTTETTPSISDPDLVLSGTGRRVGADGPNRVTLVGAGLLEEGILGFEASRGDRVHRSALVTLCGVIHPWPVVAIEPGTGGSSEGLIEAPKPTDSPRPALPQCGTFGLTSPRDGLANGFQTFYWNPAPDAQAYRISVYDGDTGALLAQGETPAPNTSLTLDISQTTIGGGFNFIWEVQALYNGVAFCGDKVALLRAAAPGAPVNPPGQPGSGEACYSVDARAIGPGPGSVSVLTPPNCAGKGYSLGTSVQVQANPNAGQGAYLSYWTGSCTGASGSGNPITVTVNGNCTVEAYLDILQ